MSLALGNWARLAYPATATAHETNAVDAINTIVRVSVAGTVVLTAVTAALELRRIRRLSES